MTKQSNAAPAANPLPQTQVITPPQLGPTPPSNKALLHPQTLTASRLCPSPYLPLKTALEQPIPTLSKFLLPQDMFLTIRMLSWYLLTLDIFLPIRMLSWYPLTHHKFRARSFCSFFGSKGEGDAEQLVGYFGFMYLYI